MAALAAVVVLEARRRGFAWSRFLDVLSSVDAGWLLVACFLSVATYFGRAFRWRVLMRGVCPHPRMRALISSTLIGFAAVTAFGRPGELVRPYLIASRQQVSFSSQLAAWVVERIYDLLVALLIFGFALSQLHAENGTMNPGPALEWLIRVGGWIVLIASLLCLSLLVLIHRVSKTSREKLLQRLSFLGRHRLGSVERILGTFLQGASCTRSMGATLEVVFWSVLEWVMIAACYAAIVQSFGGSAGLSRSFDLLDVIILMGFVSFGSLVQLPGVGGGVQVAGMLVLTGIFGLPVETATSFAVLIWLITFVLVVPIGAMLALTEGISWATLRGARQQAALPGSEAF